MAEHGYETGRLNLPFVGISTFAKSPYVADWDNIDADVAVLGAPFDFGAVAARRAFRPPRHPRASTLSVSVTPVLTTMRTTRHISTRPSGLSILETPTSSTPRR